MSPEPRKAAEAPPSDFLFRRALIPKHDPFVEYVFPLALYTFCVITHHNGGRDLWDQYRRRFDDPLTEETHRDTGRLSLSFIGSVALHVAGALMLIPFFDLIATLQPTTARMRAPLITPILVKVPTRIVLPKSNGESEVAKETEGRGKRERPNAGSDSRAQLANKGVEAPKPSLKKPEPQRDAGRPDPTVIADLQAQVRQPELPPILLWSDQNKPNQSPESVVATAVKRPTPPVPDTSEALLAMRAKALDFRPKLTLDLASLKASQPKDAIEKPSAVDTEGVRRTAELRGSTGTGDEGDEGIRLMTATRPDGLARMVEMLPSSQLNSIIVDDGTTGGAIYAIGNVTVSGMQPNRYLPGRYGGSGGGTGGFGAGVGDGVGRGSQGGDDAGAKSTLADLLAAMDLAEPERSRTIIHAEDGNFDLVVTQTSLGDVFAGAKGVLRGDRIETVYIQVGSSKEWILQYCEHNGVATMKDAATSGVFVMEDSAPLSAPFPAITVRPPSPVMPKATYVMLHGYINAEGEFAQLTVIGSRFRSLLPMLKPTLSKWRFRPAARDGKPVQVEVLLLIPPVAI
ncbi:MAG: energy transducer TonB [Bryobacterales bacterium]|nr:energy transducer TonB [Bryobacterales bacterium]